LTNKVRGASSTAVNVHHDVLNVGYRNWLNRCPQTNRATI